MYISVDNLDERLSNQIIRLGYNGQTEGGRVPICCALKWLRQEKGINVAVSTYTKLIDGKEKHAWDAAVVDMNDNHAVKNSFTLEHGFPTYESAASAWIRWTVGNYQDRWQNG